MLPGMASPAADGYGFALSLPTLMSMFPAGGHTDPDGEEGDASFSGLLTSPERPGDEVVGREGSPRSSMAMDMSHFGGEMPPTLANLFSKTGEGNQSKRTLCMCVCSSPWLRCAVAHHGYGVPCLTFPPSRPDTFTITSSTLLTTRFTSTICK